MSKDYGSSTIDKSPTRPFTGKPVQPPIGLGPVELLRDNRQMLNGHIGGALSQVVTPPARAELIAADGTPAVGPVIIGEATWSVATGTWRVKGEESPEVPVPLEPPPIVDSTYPVTTGNEFVGSSLSIISGYFASENVTSVSYVWRRKSDGKVLPHITSQDTLRDSYYAIREEDLGESIYATVTYTGPGGSIVRDSKPIGPVRRPKSS